MNPNESMMAFWVLNITFLGLKTHDNLPDFVMFKEDLHRKTCLGLEGLKGLRSVVMIICTIMVVV